jgi:hypothetical protein
MCYTKSLLQSEKKSCRINSLVSSGLKFIRFVTVTDWLLLYLLFLFQAQIVNSYTNIENEGYSANNTR